MGGTMNRILVADDMALNRRLLASLLEELDLTADTVTNGKQVLEKLAVKKYACLLIDLNMPEMDGLKTISELRCREWPARNVPIIVISAFASGPNREKCFLLGVNDVLTKPIQLETLQDTLYRWGIVKEATQLN
jgi:CheY-like chemotaxis protein